MDLYCGVGTIGLCCAEEAEAVVGIEIVKEAVLNANRNAVINNVVNARYICGKAEEVLPEYIAAAKGSDDDSKSADDSKVDMQLARWLEKAKIAILDPPRAGVRPELLETIAATSVDRIVYVSCDPATMARDIKRLAELGFRFAEATPVDMFPWTASIECCSLLVKTSDSVAIPFL